MSFSSQVAVLSLTASLFAFSPTSGRGFISSARGTTNGTETDDVSSEEIGFIILGACGLLILVVGIIIIVRMRKNTKRFTQQNAYFDRLRSRDQELQYQYPPTAPYELQPRLLATQADERKY